MEGKIGLLEDTIVCISTSGQGCRLRQCVLVVNDRVKSTSGVFVS